MFGLGKEEKRMRYLEELENKVLRLIQTNQELRTRLDALTQENELLRNRNEQAEVSLLKETNATQLLAQEKAAIMSSIEELLNSINALENNAG
jgi:rRNA processing protein Krr1/Pno1